ncbi:MAG: BON domain-containing protein [Acidobacteriota bacterium]
MKITDFLLSAFVVLSALGAGACKNPAVKEQTRQAGEAIKAAGKETGEAVTAAGNAAAEETKAAVKQAGGAIKEAGQEVSASAQKAGKDITAAAERAGDSAKKELEKAGDSAKRELEQAGDTAKKKIADATVTGSIKARLIADKDVKAVSIDVDTAGGRVTLKGTAKTAAQKDAAERIARETDGVVSVDNRIVVSPG